MKENFEIGNDKQIVRMKKIRDKKTKTPKEKGEETNS